MKNLFLAILLGFAGMSSDEASIATLNHHKTLAESAMRNKDFGKAVENYTMLVDSLRQDDPGLKLNLANAYYSWASSTLDQLQKGEVPTKDQKQTIEQIANKWKNALDIYTSLVDCEELSIRAKAMNQAGVLTMKMDQKQLASAVNFFKMALKADPTDESIRYNYELAKKLLKEQEERKEEEKKKQKDEQQEDEEKNEDEEKKDKKQEEQQDNKKQEGEDKEKNEDSKGEEKEGNEEKGNKEKEEGSGDEDDESIDGGKEAEKDKEGEEKGGAEAMKEKDAEALRKQKERIEAMKKRLEEINMNPEKAKMILEAMKNQELQYYQQMRRTKRVNRDKRTKPAW